MTRLVAGPPVDLPGLRLVPVGRIRWYGAAGPDGLYAGGTKEPIALVIRSAGGTRAIGLDGEARPLGPLVREVEGLSDLLG